MVYDELIKNSRRNIHGFGSGKLTSNEEIYARNRGIEVETYNRYTGISADEAIRRFLCEESQKELEQKGLYFPDEAEKLSQKLCQALVFLGHPDGLDKYRDEFESTKEGGLWFLCFRKTDRDYSMINSKNWLAGVEMYESRMRDQKRTRQKLRYVKFTG